MTPIPSGCVHATKLQFDISGLRHKGRRVESVKELLANFGCHHSWVSARIADFTCFQGFTKLVPMVDQYCCCMGYQFLSCNKTSRSKNYANQFFFLFFFVFDFWYGTRNNVVT